MTPEQALTILKEFNQWRRGEGIYAWNEDPTKNRELPFKPGEIGQAIDMACEILDKVVNLK